jgi:CubicO group peptidase (beta-lactamase class C family)
MSTNQRFSAARLDRMHDAMRRQVDRGHVPGVVTLVGRRGEEHVDAIGTHRFDGGAPMRHDTIFRLASMTKPLTAVATMILVEECALRLDDPVDAWLPELAHRRVLRTLESPLDDTVPAARAITLRDLLTFRCGYGEVFFSAPTSPMQAALAASGLPLAGWPFAGTADDFMERLGALPLACQPGERWLYHMPAEVLGVLIARVSGKPLGEFMRERIFEPLGMKDTAFWVPEQKLDRLPACYVRDFATGEVVVRDEARGGLYARPPAFEGGGGGLVSTVADLHAFGRMLLNQGKLGRERILARASIELMTTDQITPDQKAASPFFPGFWDACGWGLGLGVIAHRLDVGRNEGSFGWDGAFGTSFWVDPKEELVGVLMVQRAPDTLTLANPVGADFWTSAYQAMEG